MPKVPTYGGPRVQDSIQSNPRFNENAPLSAFGGGRSLDQNIRASNDLIQVGLEIKNRVDRSMVSEALNNLKNSKRDLLLDQNKGALNQKGKNAFGLMKTVSESFGKDVDKLKLGLENDDQRTMFDQYVQSEKQDLDLDVQRHVLRETESYENEQSKSLIENYRNDALLNYTDNNKIRSSLISQNQEIVSFAQRTGKPKEWIDQAVMESNSQTHTGVVQAYMSTEDYGSARSYFRANKDDFTAKDKMMLERALQRDPNKSRSIKLQKLHSSDPWEFWGEVGYLNPKNGFKPIDFSNPNSVLERVDFVDMTSKNTGYDPASIPLLHPQEVDKISDFLSKSDINKMTAFVKNIAVNSDPSVSVRIADQLFQKDPSMGMAMAVAPQDFNAAQNIIAGRKLFDTALNKGGTTGRAGLLKPSSKDISEAFDAYVGNAIPDPSLRFKMREASFYHYAKGQFDANNDMQAFDNESFNESLEKIFGPTLEMNDQKLFSFRDDAGKFVEPSELEDSFDGLTDEIVMKTHGEVPMTLSGEPVNLEKTQGRFKPKMVGDGLYILTRNGEVLLDKNKQPFEINMKSIVKYNRENAKAGLLDKIKGIFN